MAPSYRNLRIDLVGIDGNHRGTGIALSADFKVTAVVRMTVPRNDRSGWPLTTCRLTGRNAVVAVGVKCHPAVVGQRGAAEDRPHGSH